MSKRFLSGINVTGTATLNTVADAGSNTDKFLVLDASNNVSYRTAAELYADLGIGALPAAYTSTLKHEVKASQTISKGQAVYVSSADGTNMIVSKASNVSEATSSKTMGLLETSLVTNGKGNVITEGLLSGLNTNGANAGDPVWLGVDGALIFGLINKPVAPAHLVFIGIVTRANANNGEIFVKVQNGFEMNEIHNYQEGSVQNNQVIVYESATSLYKPKSIPTILGYTPVPDSRTLTINGTTYDLSANRAWTITTDASARSILRYVATANQTTFTISGGYTPGLTDVYRNGVKLDNTTDFTATNGTTIVLTNGASVNDVIEVYRYQTAFLANNALRVVTEFIATAGQTTFNVTYNSGLVDVFYNGSKLVSSEFTAGNGTTIVLNFPCNVNDSVAVHAYSYQVGAFSGQAQLNGTGLVRMSGTTVTYDNATYATQSYVTTAVANLVNSAPATLDTLNELATALGNDANFATTITTSISTKQAQLNGTGFVKVSGTTVSYDNSTYLTSINSSQVTTALGYTPYNATNPSGYITSSALSSYLPLTGGTLTGALSGTSATFSGNISLQKNQPQIQLYQTGADHNYSILGNTSTALEFWHGTFGVNTTKMLSLAAGTGAATFSSRVTANDFVFSGTNAVLQNIVSAGTSPIYGYFQNTGGVFYFGRDNSSGTEFGAGAYSSVLWNTGNNAIVFATNNTQKMTITSGGNVGIGTISPATKLTVYPVTGVISGTNDAIRLQVSSYENGARNTIVWGQDAGNLALGRFGLEWNGNTSQMNFVWRDMYNSAAGSSELMRLTGGGNLLIGTTSDNGQGRLRVNGNATIGNESVSNPAFITFNNAANGYRFGVNGSCTQFEFTNGAPTLVATIAGASGVYTALSDVNKKKDFEDSNIGLNEILQLKPTLFRFKDAEENSQKELGFIAQEVKEFIPQAYIESGEGEDIFIGLQDRPIIAALVKAVQEQQAQIEELKALIAAK